MLKEILVLNFGGMMMNNFEECLKHISDIKKEMHNKNVELKQLKDRQVSLNEELEMCQTKISWFKEDIEDLICDYFSNVGYVSMNDSSMIEVKLNFCKYTELNLENLVNFATEIGKDLKDIKICPYNGTLLLRILL